MGISNNIFVELKKNTLLYFYGKLRGSEDQQYLV